MSSLWLSRLRANLLGPVVSSLLILILVLTSFRVTAPPHGAAIPRTPLNLAASRHARIAWQHVEDFAEPLAQFPSVFWEPRDTESLRRLIRETDAVRGKYVLEIGTGTGLIALCCLQAGARQVVATDLNPVAIENARYNAQRFGWSERLDARLVPLAQPQAFTVVGDTEVFDLILSNPPWENKQPQDIGEYALYDQGFRLLRSMLRDCRRHLRPQGRMLLAYGHREAVEEVLRAAQEYGLSAAILDERRLEDLPVNFLPGMLIEVRPQTQTAAVSPCK